MALTDLATRRALPGPKIIKLSDGGGLRLWITPDGAKRWRLAYRCGGAQKTFAIGVYPEVGLKDARDARDGARQTLAQGKDPSQVKKGAKIAQAESGTNTFATIARDLAEKKRRDRKAAATLRKFEWFMSFALPALGSRPIGEISAREVLTALKKVEARGIHETARKLRTAIGDVFRYAIATAREVGFDLVAEFVEVETGKGSDALGRGPQLAAVLAKARALGARSWSPISNASRATCILFRPDGASRDPPRHRRGAPCARHSDITRARWRGPLAK
jgi:hypothetical protein